METVRDFNFLGSKITQMVTAAVKLKDPVYKTAKEIRMYRTVFWTLWERERVGRFGRMALKDV